jgi:hypothetical protein
LVEHLQPVALAALVGIGGTVFMDIWAQTQRRLFGIPALDYCMVGRWLGHLPKGRMRHQSIAKAPQLRGECTLGWIAHYAIGVAFAGLLVAIWGVDWIGQPTLAPALIIGLATVLAPFLILQPVMGAGIAGSKTPKPNTARLRSLVAHLSFGLGLYLSAVLLALLL